MRSVSIGVESVECLGLFCFRGVGGGFRRIVRFSFFLIFGEFGGVSFRMEWGGKSIVVVERVYVGFRGRGKVLGREEGGLKFRLFCIFDIEVRLRFF